MLRSCRQLADDLAAVDDQHAVGDRQQLVQLAGDEQHAGAARACAADLGIDRLDGADVEAAGRLRRQQEYQRIQGQLARQHRLLLVAARQAGHRRVGAGRADVVRLHPLLGDAGHEVAAQQAESPVLVQRAEQQVLGDAELQVAAHRVAVLGDDAHAPARQRARRLAGDVGAADQDTAGGGRAQSGQDCAQLALAVPLDAGQADDLAPTDGQRQVQPDHAARVLDHQPVQPQRFAFHRGRVRLGRRTDVAGGGALDVQRAHLAADHGADQRAEVRPRARHVARLDHPAPAQDRGTRGDLGDLGQLVRDQHQPAAPCRQAPADLQQRAHLARRQHGRRLVEHEQLRPVEQAAQHLDALALTHRQILDGAVEVDLEPVLFGQRPHPPAHGGQLQRAPARPPEQHVLERRHVADEREMLVDHGDARGQGVRGAGRQEVLPAQPQVARVRTVHTEHDVAERALAGPVLAQQAVNLAGLHLEGDVLQRGTAPEVLRDPVQGQDRRGAGRADIGRLHASSRAS